MSKSMCLLKARYFLFLKDTGASTLDSIHENRWGCWKAEKGWQETALVPQAESTQTNVSGGTGAFAEVVQRRFWWNQNQKTISTRLWSVNSAEFSSLPLWPSFDHWPLQQNTNHKFMHYYLSAARGIRILSAWTASWLFTHMTPGSTGLAAVQGKSVTYCICSHKSSFFISSEISPPCR